MRLLLSIAIALLVCTAALPVRAADAPVAGVHWRSIGPAISGGRIDAVAGTDADPSLYYAGSAGGGVWKTTDAGATWQPVFDAQDVAAAGAVTIDPTDANVVWVGTGEAAPRNDVTQGDGIYKTRDGGKTWTRVLFIRNSTVSAIVVDPRRPQHVVAGVLGDPFADSQQRGIYVTDDGGATWKQTLYLSPASGVSDVVMNPARPRELLAGMWHFRRTGWGFDSGGSDDGLFRSQDGGLTWNRLTGNGLPAGTVGRIGVAYGVSDPNRVYAIVENKGALLYRSDDGGVNWRAASGDRLIDERPFYYSRLFVDPTDANHVFTVSVHLVASTDGGSTFSIVGNHVHGDHHTMWFSRDGTRIIEGNDGGIAFSHTRGRTWQSRLVLPVSQPYRIGYSRGTLYRVCLPLQDNGIYCAPSNPRANAISSSDWRFITGGDGTTSIVDPRNPHLIWTATAGGNYAGAIEVTDDRTNHQADVSPYVRDINVVDPKDLRYRFNWETPLVFDPFDPSHIYAGGNVLFETRNSGQRWTPISPDLTRNDPSHERISGGITLDGTGAETSETLLGVAPSLARRAQIWAGSDDGLLHLTRDGGRHWTNVTPSGIAPWGRFGSISTIPGDAATAYAVYDRHMVGDRAPYVFATHDYGAHWQRITNGLRDDDQGRSVLADPRVRGVLFLGTERGLWASWNDGASWASIAGDLPPVSVRDIEYQPDAHDLLVATHGRGAFVFDDASALEQLHAGGGAALFPVRDAVQYETHDYFRTGTDGEAPDYGATFTFYQPAAAATPPRADILDAGGHVVRTLSELSNDAGLNRFSWDTTGPVPAGWSFAPKWNREYGAGAPALPGRYRIRLYVGATTYERSFNVRPDPASPFSVAQLAAHRNEVAAMLGDLGRIDAALNVLGTVRQEAPLRRAKAPATLAAALAGAGRDADALIATITSDPQNDQDNDFLMDRLRERLQTALDSLNTNYGTVTAAQRREDAALHAAVNGRISAYSALRQKLRTLDAELASMHLPALDVETVKPQPRGNGVTGRRRSDDG